jgi:CRISPR/Cas system-associated exonuclease Cas4 (RecB family)
MEELGRLVKELAEGGTPGLRFGVKCIAVSDVAAQYYCEKKVEMAYTYGEIETLGMKKGEEAHEFLLKDAVKTDWRQILREIYSGKLVLIREMLLLGKHGDTILAGRCDAVLFFKNRPLLLFEHKFSSKRIPFSDHHVQARLYCYLLHLMGWDTSGLRYALIMAPLESRDDPQLRKTPSHVVRALKEKKDVDKVVLGKASVYLNRFDLKKTVEELEWALDFWKQKREPIPTRKPAKCLSCEFRGKCEYGRQWK